MTDLQQRGEAPDLDRLESAMLGAARAGVTEPIELPLVHRFTPGLYTREIFMPAGTLLTSRIHKTEHPFVVLTGKVSVYIPGEGVEHIEAPHVGVTQPGTRRVLYIHEDCRWLTFHRNPNGHETPEDLEPELIEHRELEGDRTAFELYDELLRRLPGHEGYGGAP